MDDRENPLMCLMSKAAEENQGIKLLLSNSLLASLNLLLNECTTFGLFEIPTSVYLVDGGESLDNVTNGLGT